jgi:cholesterol transport system auxiliary component
MTKPLRASILLAVLAASLCGCVSLLPKSKPAQLYRFGAASSPPTPPAESRAGLVLGQVAFPRASTSDGILTTVGDQTAYVAGARWVAPARVLFQEAAERAFEDRSTTSQIVNLGDVGPAAALLRLDVLTFEARYARPGRAPTATIELTARLSRADGRLLGQKAFSAEIPAPSDSVSGIVKGLDAATDKVLGEVVGWTDERIAAAATTPSPTTTITTTTNTTSSSTSKTAVTRPQR